jgi:hypothetical protein
MRFNAEGRSSVMPKKNLRPVMITFNSGTPVAVAVQSNDPLQPSGLSKSWVAFSNLLICRYGKLSFNKKVK